MKTGDLVFVYGTLRQGEGADLTRWEGTEFVRPDCINGRLYHLGGFPGVKTEAGVFCPGSPSVRGEVFRVNDAGTLSGLDRYEGYPSLYDRIQTMTASGETVWVYVYNGFVDDKMLIASGDWRNQMAVMPSPCGSAF